MLGGEWPGLDGRLQGELIGVDHDPDGHVELAAPAEQNPVLLEQSPSGSGEFQQENLAYSLNSLKGVYRRLYSPRLLKGYRKLDYSPCATNP